MPKKIISSIHIGIRAQNFNKIAVSAEQVNRLGDLLVFTFFGFLLFRGLSLIEGHDRRLQGV